MIVEKIFDTNIIRVSCEHPEWYQNDIAHHSLNKLFKHHSKHAPEIVGHIETSLTSPMPVEMLPGLEHLMIWIKTQIMLAAPYFVNFSPSTFELDKSRTWANKMFKGSKVLAHTHDVVPGTKVRHTNDARGVAIFYLQLPEKSSDLIFLQGKEEIAANVQQGELIFHTKDVLHAVTEHKSEIPRICLVFEFTYLP